MLVHILYTLLLSALPAFSKPSVSSGWYTGWHAEDFPLSAVSWSKYTHLIYAFAVPTTDGSLTLDGSAPEVFPQFVSEAKKHGVKPMISIGGWSGSLYFSDNVADAANRTAFVKTVVDFAQKYEVAGVEFDWEYPGQQGLGCNTISPNDTTNFLAFLQELRGDPIGKGLILSAAVGGLPFVDADGNNSADVSAFAKVLNFVELMIYDFWGPWTPTAGPNAPLHDSCAAADDQMGAAEDSVAAWAAAGFPAAQVVLGVPSYGHTFRVNNSDALPHGGAKLALYPAFDAADVPFGDKWDDDGTTPDECGNVAGTPGGVYDFWGLVEDGFLNELGLPAHGIASVFDTCTVTPFVYNATSNVYVSYDNAESFAAKGAFVRQHNLAGFAMWEVGGDYKDILLNSIKLTSGLWARDEVSQDGSEL